MAIQAPTGGNIPRYHFVVVTDETKRADLATLYKRAYFEVYSPQRQVEVIGNKVRGLRTIERRVLEERRRTAALAPSPAPGPPQADETPCVAISEAAAPEACAAAIMATAGLGQVGQRSLGTVAP